MSEHKQITMDEILFLQDAVKAIATERLRAASLHEHAETCLHCRSRVLSFFFVQCQERERLKLDHSVAQESVNQISHELLRRQVDLEKQFTEVESLEGLFKLRDDRSE